jgi:hypothetical protein
MLPPVRLVHCSRAATLNCSSLILLSAHHISLTGRRNKDNTNRKRTLALSNCSRPFFWSISLQPYFQGSFFRRFEPTANRGDDEPQHDGGVGYQEAHVILGRLHNCTPRRSWSRASCSTSFLALSLSLSSGCALDARRAADLSALPTADRTTEFMFGLLISDWILSLLSLGSGDKRCPSIYRREIRGLRTTYSNPNGNRNYKLNSEPESESELES